mmetsp:Transcript_15252/g.35776  ORF Transcript_15252/g.35776 Transcript_15252/m.35776 type:complete len:200 (+) Transcript_15252:747-1346(+)
MFEQRAQGVVHPAARAGQRAPQADDPKGDQTSNSRQKAGVRGGRRGRQWRRPRRERHGQAHEGPHSPACALLFAHLFTHTPTRSLKHRHTLPLISLSPTHTRCILGIHDGQGEGGGRVRLHNTEVEHARGLVAHMKDEYKEAKEDKRPRPIGSQRKMLTAPSLSEARRPSPWQPRSVPPQRRLRSQRWRAKGSRGVLGF